MSSKYEKSISMEEEGTYHSREVESVPPKTYTTQSYQVVPVKSHHNNSKAIMKHHKSGGETSDDDNFEEWTTSKKKVNHKTRQVETRVSRQLLVEDGKVIADSGPQVTTRIKEDNKIEECKKEKTPKNKSKFDAIENAPEGESTGRVLGEKKEIQRVTHEVREENMQYHDERFKELTGHDVHRRAIQAPHELITISDKSHSQPPKGKMVHYTNKGKKYQDTDEILEVAKLAKDGSITKEVKRTKHHEEFSDTEKPDETGEGDELRKKPFATRSSRRHVDLVNDFDDTSTPSVSSDDEIIEEDSRGGTIRRYKAPSSGHRHHGTTKGKQHHHKQHHSKLGHHKHSRDDEAFPRYEIDPLLNSLNDEDFKPITSSTNNHHHHNNLTSSSSRFKEHSIERKNCVDSRSSSDNEVETHYSQRSPSPYSRAQPNTGGTVEIPEEYRVNKQRLIKSKTTSNHPRERSFSPTNKSHLSHASHKSSKSHKSHKEDASVQAHLTDEEEERKSMRSSSSSGANSHEKTTRHLQRQSTANSSRNYYFGEKRHRRPSSISSSSTSSDSLVNSKDELRKNGARSRDSGFRSPQATQEQKQQIYSVSSKSKRRGGGADEYKRSGATSPTPTTGSVGQRSVKTTTTTMSAGLTDRPGSPIKPERLKRSEKVSSYAPSSKEKGGSKINSKHFINKTVDKAVEANFYNIRAEPAIVDTNYHNYDDQDRHNFDSVSLSSLGPNATTIKVPYNPEELNDKKRSKRQHDGNKKLSQGLLDQEETRRSTGNDMNLREDIEKLRRRLANIDSKTITVSRDNKSPKTTSDDYERQHFDYKTVIANVKAAPLVPRQQVVDAYNVRVIEHKSPFSNEQNQPVKSVNELSNSIARLELLSRDVSDLNAVQENNLDNNNETNFKLSEFSKYRKPAGLLNNLEADNVSLVSSCSLRSSRTYDVRVTDDPDDRIEANGDLDDERHFPVEVQNFDSISKEKYDEDNYEQQNEQDEDGKRPAAWVYDLRDGSSTAIVAQPRPKKPESPKIDSKTEDLAESRGGRSYYLELIEPEKKQQQKADQVVKRRPSSIDSLYSRWNSHSTLSGSSNNRSSNQQHNSTPDKSPSVSVLNTKDTRKSRQIMPASILDSNNRPIYSTNSINNSIQQPARRQLPFAGQTLSNRSKSSSCLIGPTTRQSKYSIYGGLRKPNNDNKPVPRLSYSRAIGPKSQRQIDAQPKTPSRYLKMK